MDQKTLDHILNALRKASTTWHGRQECLNRTRILVWEGECVKKGKNKGKKKYKYFYQCAQCKERFRDQESLEVDHIKEIGPYTGNIHEFAERIYCDQSNLQALCLACHKRKTAAFTSALFRYKRK